MINQIVPTPQKAAEKMSEDTGDRYELSHYPISEGDYRVKVNYYSYFSLIGIPHIVADKFHEKVYRKDVAGAINAIRPYFRELNTRKNIRLIKEHLDNAVSRITPQKDDKRNASR